MIGCPHGAGWLHLVFDVLVYGIFIYTMLRGRVVEIYRGVFVRTIDDVSGDTAAHELGLR
jgi:hypothetical protein